MNNRYVLFVLIGLFPFLLSNCGTVQSSNWLAFADSLGTGSEVRPAQGLFTLKGDIEVSMTKAANPEWDSHAALEYPYAGIMMQFWRSGNPLDISAATGLSLEYRLAGNVSLMLAQENLPPGQEYRLTLPPQENFTVVYFPWEDFRQPPWIKSPTALNLERMVSIMFTNSSEEHSTAMLSVRQMSFPGWSDPHSFLATFKGLGQ